MKSSNTLEKYLINWGGELYEGIIISLKYDDQQECYTPINISMPEVMKYEFTLHWDGIECKGEYNKSYHIYSYGDEESGDVPGFSLNEGDIRFCCDEDRLIMRKI